MLQKVRINIIWRYVIDCVKGENFLSRKTSSKIKFVKHLNKVAQGTSFDARGCMNRPSENNSGKKDAFSYCVTT